METNRTPDADAGTEFSWSRALLFGLSLLFLVFIWHRNYNVLGSFHDYSVVTSVGGHMHHGLLPYRDFTTPLQSLTIYLCYGSELVFGPRYLALAYGNLVLGLVCYLAVLGLLPRELGFPLRVLSAMAVCVCTLYQHGIIWYNPVAMALLAVLVLYTAGIFRRDSIGPGQIARLGALLFLSSMGKVNFHFLGVGMVGLALVLWCWIHRPRPAAAVVTAGVLVFCAFVPGPVTEILLNHTTPSDFFHDVIVTPAKRSGHLLGVIDPNLFFGNARIGFPDNWCSGAFLYGFLIYCGCWFWAFCARKPGMTPAVAGISLLLPVFFGASMMLAATNDETQMLTSSFLVVGWVAVFTMLQPFIAAWQREVLTFGACILGAFFLIAGGASAFMHSRVRIFEPSWSTLMMSALYNGKSLSALKNVMPLYDAREMFPGNGYLDGVQLTEAGRKPLEKAAAFMARTHAGKSADDIYWGPDGALIGRIYDSPLRVRLPQWYDLNVTLHPSDSPWIIEALKKARYEWIVNTHEAGLPPAVMVWINENYECQERDDIIVYHALHPAAAQPDASRN